MISDSSVKRLLVIVSFLLVVSSSLMLTIVEGQTFNNRVVLDQGTQSWERYVWRPSVIYQNSLFTMWYSGEDTNGASKIGVAFSSDGVLWARSDSSPVLTVGGGGEWDSGSVQESWVILDGTTYKMWYTGETFDEKGGVLSAAIGYATSADGTHWTKFKNNPVLSSGPAGSWDDEWVFRPSVISTGSSYIMYYQGKSKQSDTISIGYATSGNGTDWVKYAQPISPSQSGWNSYSSYLGGINKIADEYVMFTYGSKSSDEPFSIGFAKSPDGITWRTNPIPVITYESPGSWDDDGAILPTMVIAHNSYYVYYTGLERNVGARIGLSTISMSTYPIPEFTAPSLVAAVILLSCTGFFLFARRRKPRD